MAKQDYGGIIIAVQPDEPVERTETVLPPSSVMTAVSDVYMPPDLTVQCVVCAAYIHMHAVPEHRAYHHALENLHIEADAPSTPTCLMSSRQEEMLNLLRQADSQHPVQPWRVNVMDDSFEILKSYMEETFDNLRMVKPESEPQASSEMLDTECQCVCSASVCTDMNGDLRNSMEDAHVFIGDFDGSRGDARSTFLGVYDGHNGRYAVETVQSNIQKYLEAQLQESAPGPVDPTDSELTLRGGLVNFSHDALYKRYADAFRHAYMDVDKDVAMAEDESSRVRWSGCSALSAVIETSPKMSELSIVSSSNDDQDAAEVGRMYLANAGDVRAVISKQANSYRISKDHTTANKKEAARVRKAGGEIMGSGKSTYVYGVMSTTRGIGNHGDPRIRKCVLPIPRTACVVLDDQMEFIVIATKGIWSVFSDDEVVALMAQFLPKYHQNPPPLSLTLCRKLSFISDAGGDVSSSTKKSNLKVENNLRPITATTGLSVTWEDQPENENEDSNAADNIEGEPSGEMEGGPSGEMEGLTKERLELHNDTSTLMIPQLENADISKSFASLPYSFPASMNFHSAEEISRRMSERLVQSAILAGSKENASVMIILLPGWDT